MAQNLKMLTVTVDLKAKNLGKAPDVDEVLSAARELGWKRDAVEYHDELFRDMAEVTGRLRLRWSGSRDEVLAQTAFTIYLPDGGDWIWDGRSAAGVFNSLYENGLRLRSTVIKQLVRAELEKGVGEPDRMRRLSVS
jgi:hypothetical protein